MIKDVSKKLKKRYINRSQNNIYEAYKKHLITKSECAELLEIKGFDIIYQLVKCDLLKIS